MESLDGCLCRLGITDLVWSNNWFVKCGDGNGHWDLPEHTVEFSTTRERISRGRQEGWITVESASPDSLAIWNSSGSAFIRTGFIELSIDLLQWMALRNWAKRLKRKIRKFSHAPFSFPGGGSIPIVSNL